MNRRSARRTGFAALFVCVTVSGLRDARAECTVTGVASVSGLRVGPIGPLDLEQSMVATFVGRRATIEGLTPLVFRGETAANAVKVYIRDGAVLRGLVGVARGLRVEVERAERDAVVATLRDDGGLTVRSVRVPCALLEGAPSAGTPSSPPRPSFPEDRRWRGDGTARQEFRCTRGPGNSMGCAPVRGRCSPVGDASVCGYHPRAAQLRVHARPDARSAAVVVEATADISFADDSGNGAWLRVYSRGAQGRDALVVRGWVRRADVRWTQEVPPSFAGVGLGCYGTIGRATILNARVGFVSIAAQTSVFDAAGVEWASTAAPLCARAQQAPNRNVSVELDVSPTRASIVWVVPSAVRWVERCP